MIIISSDRFNRAILNKFAQIKTYVRFTRFFIPYQYP